MKYAAMLLLACLSAGAQSAKVIQLSDGDAAEAKSLQVEQKELDTKREKFRIHITRDYLVTTDPSKGGMLWSDGSTVDGITLWGTASSSQVFIYGSEPRCETPAEKAARKAEEKKAEQAQAAYAKSHPRKYLKAGWDNPGYFEYSDDFQFIVPATPVVSTFTTQPPSGWVVGSATSVGR